MPKTEVVLNIYYLYETKGLWHTGVAVHGTEYYYCTSGIKECEPGKHDSNFHEAVTVGYTNMTRSQTLQWIESVSEEFRGDLYHPFRLNCNDFSARLCDKLCGDIAEFPDYLKNLQVRAKVFDVVTDGLGFFIPKIREVKNLFEGSVMSSRVSDLSETSAESSSSSCVKKPPKYL